MALLAGLHLAAMVPATRAVASGAAGVRAGVAPVGPSVTFNRRSGSIRATAYSAQSPGTQTNYGYPTAADFGEVTAAAQRTGTSVPGQPSPGSASATTDFQWNIAKTGDAVGQIRLYMTGQSQAQFLPDGFEGLPTPFAESEGGVRFTFDVASPTPYEITFPTTVATNTAGCSVNSVTLEGDGLGTLYRRSLRLGGSPACEGLVESGGRTGILAAGQYTLQVVVGASVTTGADAPNTFATAAIDARIDFPVPTPTPTPVPTPTPFGVLFADDFESGNLDEWAKVSDKGPPPHMIVSPSAKFTGTEGLLFDVAGLPPPSSKAKLWVKDTSPALEARYRARFFLNLNTLAVPTTPRVLRLMVGRLAGDPAARPFELRLRHEAPNWFIYGIVRSNGDAQNFATLPIQLPKPGWSTIEIDWVKATGPGTNDGAFTLKVNGTTRTATGVPNDQVFIDGIQLGFLGGLGLTSTGTVFMDDFESRAQSDFPPVAPTPTPGP